MVALNRAVAIGELRGPAAGLAALDSLDVTLLDDYQPFHAARADLLARAGQQDAARAAYDRAIELSVNPTERRFLERQRDADPLAVTAAEWPTTDYRGDGVPSHCTAVSWRTRRRSAGIRDRRISS